MTPSFAHRQDEHGLAVHHRHYLSLDVSREGKALAPIIARQFAQEEPWSSAGAVVFDILIANSDRHDENLARDPGFAPPRVSLFDHGHALLGTDPPSEVVGVDRLNAARDRLGCLGRSPLKGNRQCLLSHVSDASALMAWAERAAAIPDFVVSDVCEETAALGLLDKRAAALLAEWLNERKRLLPQLISDNSSEFRGVKQWDLGDGAP